MTDDTVQNPAVRDLAHAIFALTTDAEGADEERKEQWQAERQDHIGLARKVLRRLENQGYSLTKAS
ncbi:MAG: hypothetical protein AB3N17_12465 [Tateyamaria sp.]